MEPLFKRENGKEQSTGRLRKGHQVADEIVMEPPRSNNKKRKKATAEMCNPPAPMLGILAVDKDKQPPLSKKKKLSTPTIWANGKVTSPTRSASCRCRISYPCRKMRSSDVLLSADASIDLSSAHSGPMLAQAEPVMPLGCPRSPWKKPEAGKLKLNFNDSCKGKSRSRGGAEQQQGAGKIHMEPPGCKKRNGKGQSAGEIRGAHQVAYELVMVPPRSKNNKRKKATAGMCANPPAPLAVHKDRQPTPSKKKKLNKKRKKTSLCRGGAEQHEGVGELHMEPPRCKKRNGKGQSAGEIREAHQVAYELVVEPPRSKNKRRKKAALAAHKDRQPTPSKKKKLNRNLQCLSKPPATPNGRANGKVVSSAPRLCKQRGSIGMCRKPDKRRLKLNFDGSSKKSGAFGGVFRDPKGKFVLGYAGRIGKATSSVAELVALERGLQLALDNGWRDISVEGDFKTAVDAIAGHARVRAKEDREHFTAITKMLPRLGKVTVTHVGREGNKVADRFAKLGHKAAAQMVWRGVPPPEVLVHLRRAAKSKPKLKTRKK